MYLYIASNTNMNVSKINAEDKRINLDVIIDAKIELSLQLKPIQANPKFSPEE
jgi:hypothetical protein